MSINALAYQLGVRFIAAGWEFTLGGSWGRTYFYYGNKNAETIKYETKRITEIPINAMPDQKNSNISSQNLNIKYRIKQVTASVIIVSIKIS